MAKEININESVSVDVARAGTVVSEHTRGFYSIDKATLVDDIERFKGKLASTSNKMYIKAYKDAIKYLSDMESKIVGNYITAIWYVDSKGIKSKPLQIEGMGWIGLNPIDYMLKRDEITVEIDYRDLWNIIAISVAHRDLGFSTSYIDYELEKLKTSLNSVESSSVLMGITSVNAYNDAIELRVEDTQYRDYSKFGSVKNTDYFGEQIKSDRYVDIINSSVDKAMVIILTELLGSIPGGCSAEFLGIVDGKIYLNTNMSSSEINEIASKRVVVRSIGRLFEVNPIVAMY